MNDEEYKDPTEEREVPEQKKHEAGEIKIDFQVIM